ncbi:MAG: indolepyruvate ferredoxin oxidoreductase family protein [Burkholderiales bacterium]|jgi:indolepyruvate ferredoxin oxidoreductase|nr:indolepyruvate ferredoxin oxidoreductase family protein [Burkholderiales bacterium]
MNAPLPEAVRRALAEVTLDDKWTLDRGRAYMSGTQALIRLAMLQRQCDVRAGLNTAGFITGYRGSPLGSVDQTAWRARKHLDAHHVRFQPGVNEDLAATSVWGTQQVNMFPGAKYDGVFAMWYGKGPGVDRCGDVFKHANAAGTSPHGGVLALAGDDHGAKSSTLPHQSDHIFKACMMPVLYPSTVQEYLDLGLHGFAMSRYAGVWVGMKTVTEVVEASASVVVDPERVNIVLPADFAMPAGGLNIRWPDTPLQQEARLLDYKLYAALAYCRANKLNHTVIESPHARFGIVASGKAYLDMRQALADLGLDEDTCRDIGVRVFKCGMVWPLEAQTIRGFAEGLEEILVVEEKRQLIEYQFKEELFSWIGSHQRVPRVIGKFDEKDGGEWAVPQGNWILPAHYEFSPAIVAKAIATRLTKLELPADVRARIAVRLAVIEAKEKALAKPRLTVERKPYFCSGCPHNTSTQVPEGSRAVAGIGCHYMVVWMDRDTATFTQMGGEGVPWIGQAPFTEEKHVFANLGDGTYFHSGYLAVRAAVAAKVPITYKILFNDAVAMTGGQTVDGQLTVPQITQQMAAEGVGKIVIVTDEPGKYDATSELDHSATNAKGATGNAWTLAAGVTVHHRDELDRIQRELREYPGVSVLIYDQTCASEKRRRRKQNKPDKIVFPDPPRRTVINELVCEGCGDCSVQSNCLSVEPLETEFGRKRKINQSTCNKDFSCLKGFCPSFVTVEGGKLRKGAASAAGATLPALPQPQLVGLPEQGSYDILITGVGGTGVVTIGQLLGMAAHMEGRALSVLDMAGLAQKGGAVFSHARIATRPANLFATRIAMGEADLLLGCDLIVSTNNEALGKIQSGRTRAVVNTTESPTADFVTNPDWQFGAAAQLQQLRDAVGRDEDCAFVDAQGLATALLGDGIYANPFVLGFAWQRGWIPLSHAALTRAIELNGVAVEANLRAFEWGRAAAHDLEAVKKAAFPAQVVEFKRFASTLDEIVAKRVEFLTGYQNADYAQRYAALVERVRKGESDRLAGESKLAEAVARYYFKLLAIKDEYEVARLHSDPAFRAKIAAQFEGDYKLNFHLAPPLLAKSDPVTGVPKKLRFGPWMMTAFGVLAKLKFLRGTALDIFGRTEERKTERQLIAEYEQLIDELLGKIAADNHALAVELASLPEEIRGYGHVRARHLAAARTKWTALLAKLRSERTAKVIPLRAA